MDNNEPEVRVGKTCTSLATGGIPLMLGKVACVEVMVLLFEISTCIPSGFGLIFVSGILQCT